MHEDRRSHAQHEDFNSRAKREDGQPFYMPPAGNIIRGQLMLFFL